MGKGLLMKKHLLALALLPMFGFGQAMKQDQANWFAYVGSYNVSPKWGYHIEAQFRLNDQLSRNNQNLFRFGGFYNLNKKAVIRAGYGLINTLQPALDNYFNEDRIWEDFQYNHKWHSDKNLFTNRFRLEQRFVDKLGITQDGSIAKAETNYQNRLRYLNRHTFHLANFKSGNEELYGVVQDEVFMNLGSNNVNPKFLDQNRFHIGIGFNYKNSIRFEVTYLNHFINPGSGPDQMNHTFSLCLFQNLILYREQP